MKLPSWSKIWTRLLETGERHHGLAAHGLADDGEGLLEFAARPGHVL
jgi:hypothetical protein